MIEDETKVNRWPWRRVATSRDIWWVDGIWTARDWNVDRADEVWARHGGRGEMRNR